MEDVIPTAGLPGVPLIDILQTPGSPNDVTPLFPTMIMEITPVQQIYGELADVFWISTLATSATIVADSL